MDSNGRKKNQSHWTCLGCLGKPCGYGVPHGTSSCNACGNTPPKHVSCPGEGGKPGSRGKGDGKGAGAASHAGGNSGPAGGGGRASAPTFAEKQIRKELEAKLAQRNKEIAAFKAEAKQAKAQAEKAALGAAEHRASDSPPADVQMDPEAPGSEAVVQAIRKRINLLKKTPKELHDSFAGGYEGLLAALQAELDEALGAKWAAKPLSSW